jgi:hypothetical protein
MTVRYLQLRAFSSEVGVGLREENASMQLDCCSSRVGSACSIDPEPRPEWPLFMKADRKERPK